MTMQISNIDPFDSLINKEPKSYPKEIFIKIGNVLKKITLKDVDWFGVDGKCAYAKTATRHYPLNLSLKELEKKLDKKQFVRIHQSYMVDLKKIDAINIIDNLVLISGTQLPIGRSYKKQLMSQIVFL